MDSTATSSVELFRSQDGTVVEAEHLPGGMMRFWELGGTYRMSIAEAAFNRCFSPHSPSTILRPLGVYGSWLPEDLVLPALCDETRWNGWVKPMFTREVGLQLVGLMVGQLSYDSASEEFVDLPEGYDEPVRYAGVDVTVDGQQARVYGIGAGSWCWVLASDEAGWRF